MISWCMGNPFLYLVLRFGFIGMSWVSYVDCFMLIKPCYFVQLNK